MEGPIIVLKLRGPEFASLPFKAVSPASAVRYAYLHPSLLTPFSFFIPHFSPPSFLLSFLFFLSPSFP